MQTTIEIIAKGDTVFILYSFFFHILAGAAQSKRKGTSVSSLTKVP